jgi:hypothetical protein
MQHALALGCSRPHIFIDAKEPLSFVTFGDSDTVEVGDWVVAIGHPRGLDQHPHGLWRCVVSPGGSFSALLDSGSQRRVG